MKEKCVHGWLDESIQIQFGLFLHPLHSTMLFLGFHIQFILGSQKWKLVTEWENVQELGRDGLLANEGIDQGRIDFPVTCNLPRFFIPNLRLVNKMVYEKTLKENFKNHVPPTIPSCHWIAPSHEQRPHQDYPQIGMPLHWSRHLSEQDQVNS